MTSRRYQYRGPAEEILKLQTDPGLVLAIPHYAMVFDVTFDELVAPIATIDEAMKKFGCVPEPVDTTVSAPTPYIALTSPDGSLWQITVDDFGVVAVMKISL